MTTPTSEVAARLRELLAVYQAWPEDKQPPNGGASKEWEPFYAHNRAQRDVMRLLPALLATLEAKSGEGAKPFYNYAEDRDNLLRLAKLAGRSDDANAIELGDLVRAILEDEAVSLAQPKSDSRPVVEAEILRDLNGETVCGFRVAAYRETGPEHGDKFGHRYSEHWSTPNSRDDRVKVERLFTEDQLLAALQPASDAGVRDTGHPIELGENLWTRIARSASGDFVSVPLTTFVNAARCWRWTLGVAPQTEHAASMYDPLEALFCPPSDVSDILAALQNREA